MLLNVVGEETRVESQLYFYFDLVYRPSMDKSNQEGTNSKDI